MAEIRRARQVFIAAFIGAVVLVALEFPIKELITQRSAIGTTATQLAAVESHNAALKSDITSLSQTAQIASIAHQEYGLVKAGQRSYVILPSASSSQNVDPVAPNAIPVADLGATGTTATATSPTAVLPQASLWGRFIGHLEFWQ